MRRAAGPDARTWRRDAVGIALSAALVAWVLLGSIGHESSPLGIVSLVAAAMGAFLVGRLVGPRHRRIAASVVILVGLVLAASAWTDLVHYRPLGGPFGYSNATAAFFVQAAAAAWMVTLDARWRASAVAGAAATALFAAVPFLVHSRTAEVLVVGVLIVGAVARWGHPRPVLVTRVVAASFLLVLSMTIVLGATYRSTSTAPAGPLGSALSERRLALWSDALDLIGRLPLFGVGIDRFEDVSDVARHDRDTSQAHNDYLQLAAEAGVVAGALLVALMLWLILRPGNATTDRDRTWALLASAACGALAIHACVDYVLQTAAVPITAAYLSGIATVRGER